MIKPSELAIADVLKHPKRGLVSHQPAPDDRSDAILVYVRDVQFDRWLISLDECEWPTEEEYHRYWKEVEANVPSPAPTGVPERP